METTHTKVLVQVGERVRDAETGALIATVWQREVPEVQQEGESWLAMRARTEPQRRAAEEEVMDNARLFAAAPELLESLKVAVNIMSHSKLEGHGIDMLIRARAAVAKATGVP